MSEQAAENLKRELEREQQAAEADRDRYLSELADTAATSRAAGPPTDAAGDVEPAMVVLRDRSLPEEKRVEVIQRFAATMTRRDEYVEALLAIVQDTEDADAVRAAALDALGGAAFQIVRFRPYEEAYRQALRNLVTDDHEYLRETAVAILAEQHDPDVQQTLLTGLRGDAVLPVARERAIQLLAEDDHLDNMPWLRELYDGGSDDERLEAVRLMASYPEAADTLEGVLRDKNETTQVRQQGAASLRNLAPERFESVAKEIATDGTDDPELRAACLHTLQHLGDRDRVYGDSDFIGRLEEIAAADATPQVAQRARDLVEDQ
jgi:HEAT repeats